MKLEELLREMVDAKASDIFIIAGLPLSYEVERTAGPPGLGAAHAR